jgi:5-keto 4-deoxyuronate isomerase
MSGLEMGNVYKMDDRDMWSVIECHRNDRSLEAWFKVDMEEVEYERIPWRIEQD